MASDKESDGVWRTICGRRIFIRKGQSIKEAMLASGKFHSDVDGRVKPVNPNVVTSVEKQQEQSKATAKRSQAIKLPKKEYASVCSALRTKYGDKIPKKGGQLYGDYYYEYAYSKRQEKIECTLKIKIDDNKDLIALLMEEKKNVRK